MNDFDSTSLDVSEDSHNDCHSAKVPEESVDISFTCNMDMALCDDLTVYVLSSPFDYSPTITQNRYLPYNVHEFIAFFTPPSRPPKSLA